MGGLLPEGAADEVQHVLQDALRDSVGGMMGNWYLVGNYIDGDGEPSTMFLTPPAMTSQEAIGLLRVATISVEQEIIEWVNGG